MRVEERVSELTLELEEANQAITSALASLEKGDIAEAVTLLKSALGAPEPRPIGSIVEKQRRRRRDIESQ
jgi:hypothetical protein